MSLSESLPPTHFHRLRSSPAGMEVRREDSERSPIPHSVESKPVSQALPSAYPGLHSLVLSTTLNAIPQTLPSNPPHLSPEPGRNSHLEHDHLPKAWKERWPVACDLWPVASHIPLYGLTDQKLTSIPKSQLLNLVASCWGHKGAFQWLDVFIFPSPGHQPC